MVMRAIIILPWAVPTIVNAITCWLIYNPEYDALNSPLVQSALMEKYQSWLGNPAIALIFAVPAAYAFARRGASMALLFAFLAIFMMPPITYVLPLYQVFGSIGLR